MSGLLIVKKNFQAGDLLSDADSPHITGEKDTTLISRLLYFRMKFNILNSDKE